MAIDHKFRIALTKPPGTKEGAETHLQLNLYKTKDKKVVLFISPVCISSNGMLTMRLLAEGTSNKFIEKMSRLNKNRLAILAEQVKYAIKTKQGWAWQAVEDSLKEMKREVKEPLTLETIS